MYIVSYITKFINIFFTKGSHKINQWITQHLKREYELPFGLILLNFAKRNSMTSILKKISFYNFDSASRIGCINVAYTYFNKSKTRFVNK